MSENQVVQFNSQMFVDNVKAKIKRLSVTKLYKTARLIRRVYRTHYTVEPHDMMDSPDGSPTVHGCIPISRHNESGSTIWKFKAVSPVAEPPYLFNND